MTDEAKPAKTPGERAATWAKVISLLVATAIAVYAAAFKGEPGADQAKTRVDQTWDKAQADIARLTKMYHKLHQRVIYFQGRDEGVRAGVLKAQLDQLQAKHDRMLLANKSTKRAELEKLLTKVAAERQRTAQLQSKAAARRAVKAAAKSDSTPQMSKPSAPPWRRAK